MVTAFNPYSCARLGVGVQTLLLARRDLCRTAGTTVASAADTRHFLRMLGGKLGDDFVPEVDYGR